MPASEQTAIGWGLFVWLGLGGFGGWLLGLGEVLPHAAGWSWMGLGLSVGFVLGIVVIAVLGNWPEPTEQEPEPTEHDGDVSEPV